MFMFVRYANKSYNRYANFDFTPYQIRLISSDKELVKQLKRN